MVPLYTPLFFGWTISLKTSKEMIIATLALCAMGDKDSMFHDVRSTQCPSK
jgi:hypothetical protein